DALLYPSFALGSHGAIAAILSAAPKACVDLWDAAAKGDHTTALDLHRRLLPLWNAMFDDNLPACTKYAQSLQDCETGAPRAPMPPASGEQQRKIRDALMGLGIKLQHAA
ncbi:MAG: dihydrodipicolinate synthase family protein, partial [Geminicoccaceae bacterium]